MPGGAVYLAGIQTPRAAPKPCRTPCQRTFCHTGDGTVIHCDTGDGTLPLYTGDGTVPLYTGDGTVPL